VTVRIDREGALRRFWMRFACLKFFEILKAARANDVADED
jgi:hypothetical protein